MTDVAVLEARLAAIVKARDTGALTVKHMDTLTTFRNLDEMERIIASIQGEIAGATSPRRRVRYLWQRSKGL